MTMNQISFRLPANPALREDMLVGALNALMQARPRIGESAVRGEISRVLGLLGWKEEEVGVRSLLWMPENRRTFLRGQEAARRYLAGL